MTIIIQYKLDNKIISVDENKEGNGIIITTECFEGDVYL
jgi:hypothetical protein